LAPEPAIDITLIYVLCVILIATVIRSAFGFGEALVAVPLLAFWLPLPVAAPLAVLVSITIAGIVVIQDWKKIHLRSAGWLVVSSLFGIPLGLLLLTNSHQRGLKAALGIIIIVFAVFFSCRWVNFAGGIVVHPPSLRPVSEGPFIPDFRRRGGPFFASISAIPRKR
jgi:uncharacterized membrane protein YfcA